MPTVCAPVNENRPASRHLEFTASESALITAAPARGITTLTASVLATNTQVADLLRQVPGQFSIALDGEALNVQVCLACRAGAQLAQR
jgi:hypothetical protein